MADDLTRKLAADAARMDITGEDPNKDPLSRDRQAQRQAVAGIVRQLLEKGYDPMVIIEMYIAGAAWLADQVGVSRGQLAHAIKEVQLSGDRSLIWTPGG